MFRDSNDIPKTKTPINCLIGENGLGDLLCSLVAADYLLKN